MEDRKIRANQPKKIVIIGENHENSIARNLVKKIIEKSKREDKIKLLIEFEPSDFENLKKDVLDKKPPPPLFKPLFEILKKSNANINLSIVPIDIPLEYLLSNFKEKKERDQITCGDEVLKKIVCDNFDKIELDFRFCFPRFKNVDPSKSLYDFLNELHEKEACEAVTYMMRQGERRKELYEKKNMQHIRDQYFHKKIQKNIDENIDFLIILVGSNHFPYLYEEMKKYEIFSSNVPSERQAEEFLFDIFKVEEKDSTELYSRSTFFTPDIDRITTPNLFGTNIKQTSLSKL